MRTNFRQKDVAYVFLIFLLNLADRIHAQWEEMQVMDVAEPQSFESQAIPLASWSFAGFTNFDFFVDHWQNSGSVTPGADAINIDTDWLGTNGRAGVVFETMDLSIIPPEKVFLEIRARLLPTHAGGDIQLVLGTNPQDYTVWTIPSGQLSTTEFTTIRVSLDTPPDYIGGQGFWPTDVTNFQIGGDYSGKSDFDIEVQSMAIVVDIQPELSQN